MECAFPAASVDGGPRDDPTRLQVSARGETEARRSGYFVFADSSADSPAGGSADNSLGVLLNI